MKDSLQDEPVSKSTMRDDGTSNSRVPSLCNRWHRVKSFLLSLLARPSTSKSTATNPTTDELQDEPENKPTLRNDITTPALSPSPLPIQPVHEAEKVSIARKVRAAPPGWAFESNVKISSWDHITPPAGTYLFYGTLQNPALLQELLDLPTIPVLQPAYVMGYRIRFWGQYPALVDGTCGSIVEGSAFDVPDEEAAAKLAAYETNNYKPKPVNVLFRENGQEKCILGYSFIFCGRSDDLTDGVVDLDV